MTLEQRDALRAYETWLTNGIVWHGINWEFVAQFSIVMLEFLLAPLLICYIAQRYLFK